MNRAHLHAGILAILIIDHVTSAPLHAEDTRSPLRGTWSFSQVVPSTTLLTGAPVPLVAVGTLQVDRRGGFTGHGVFNTPVPGQQTIALDIDGTCAARDGQDARGYDCLFNFPAFNLLGIGRYCVPMASSRGRCFDELRCVNIDEPGNTVALVEFRRQQSGTCE